MHDSKHNADLKSLAFVFYRNFVNISMLSIVILILG